MKRILFVFYSLDNLGTGRENFMSRMEKYGENYLNKYKSISTFQFVYWGENPLKISQTIQTKYFEKNGLLRAAKDLVEIINTSIDEKDEIVIVLGDNLYSWIIVEMAKLRAKKRIVMQASFHGSVNHIEEKNILKRTVRRALTKILMHRADSLRFVNQEQVDCLPVKIKDRKLISIIPIPVQIPAQTKRPKSKALGFLGRIHNERGLEEWLKISIELERIQLVDEFVIVGDGIERIWFINEISKIKPSKLSYCGFLNNSDIHMAFSKMSVLLSSAPDETYGLAIREAALSGVPVVARLNNVTERLRSEIPELVFVYKNQDEAIKLVADKLNNFKLDERNLSIHRKNYKLIVQTQLDLLSDGWYQLFTTSN